MRYYYDPSIIPSSKEKQTSEVKDEWESKLREITKEFLNKNPNVRCEWTRRDTLGAVLIDFEPDEKKIISGGAGALRRNIQDKYDFILFSKNVKGKYEPIQVNDKIKGIKIDIILFNKFFKTSGNIDKVVELFLSKPTLDDFEKNMINRMMIDDPEKVKRFFDMETTLELLHLHGADKPEEFTRTICDLIQISKENEIENYDDFKDMIEKAVRFFDIYKFKNREEFTKIANSLIDIFEKYDIGSENADKFISVIVNQIKKQKIKSFDDFEKIINVTRATGKSLVDGHEYFEKILIDFDQKIKTHIKETDIRDFVFDNIWLLDFKYYGYEKKTEEHLEIGNTDISLYDDGFGLNSIVVEFKRPDARTLTSNDRVNKPAILAKVGKAISQIIHYMEDLKEKYRHVEGYVIIGERDEEKDYFLKIFNDYLHGIKIMTFTDVYDNAEKTIEAFKKIASKSKDEKL